MRGGAEIRRLNAATKPCRARLLVTAAVFSVFGTTFAPKFLTNADAATAGADGAYVYDGSLDVFRAVEVDGEILAWHPWETNWVTLKAGDKVVAGTLIQSLAAAKIIVQKENGLQAREGEDLLSFQFAVPTMLRIHAQLARHVTTSSMMIDARKTGIPFAKKAPKVHQSGIALINAWRRVKSVGALLSELTRQSTSIFSVEKKDRPMEISTPRIDIRITQPKDGAILIADQFPLEIAVQWHVDEDRKAPPEVAAYLWPTSSMRGDAASRGSGLLPVKIPGPGTYFLQVQSDDGAADSPLLMITAE